MTQVDISEPRSAKKQAEKVGLVIPLYRSPHLVRKLEANLLARAAELSHLSTTILFINDSPDDKDLQATLDEAVKALSPRIDVRVLQNDSNQGFVRSANRGLRWCLENNADALLLNSDALLAENCVSELRRVSLIDPMIGIVCPRSNNATLCSLPFQFMGKQVPFDEAFSAFRRLSGYLPEWHFVPTGVGFCMYIRHMLIVEFGFLDEVYSPGYQEENDFCCRVNRCGFRVALANRAFCYHDESVSFGSKKKIELNQRNETILNQRYPEYKPAVANYFAGPEFAFEQTLSAVLRNEGEPPRLLVDLTHFQCVHNGTFEYGKKITKALLNLTPRVFDITVMCDREEAAFHDLKRELAGVEVVSPRTEKVFDIAIKPAQPFLFEDLERLSMRAPLNFYVMLDAIALDCAYIRSQGLASLWRLAAQFSDGLIFISQFSQDQFLRRERPSPHTSLLPALCSTDKRDYGVSGEKAALPASEPYILVLGNHFDHKFITPTVEALVQRKHGTTVRVLGDCHVKHPNVKTVPSGHLSPEVVSALYRDAAIIVFPSLYEGFGFPILHGLVHDKIVCARESSLNREIIENWNGPGTLVLYRDTPELLDIAERLLAGGIEAIKDMNVPVLHGDPRKQYGWDAVARRIADMMIAAYQRAPISPLTRARIEGLRAAEITSVAELGRQKQLFLEVVASPSFRIGRGVTRLLKSIPGVYPAYRLMTRG